MNNFTFHNPTKIVFGKDTIAQLKDLIPVGESILITYGSGSIKANGVYDQVKKALAGHKVLEFGGIQPNPLYETLMQAVKIVKEQKITFLLAVGGGSVLDGTKFIAAAAHFAGADPWDLLCKGAPVKSAMPLGSVLTLPATGSESNGAAVISRKSTDEKLAFISDKVFPKFAILDPVTTSTLPERQVINGIVDAFMHVLEQYATYPAGAALQDRQAEAILQTLIEQGPKTLKNSGDYEARANLVWSATQALNGIIGCGVPQDWSTHGVGHELTAFYGVDHAQSLAIVMPRLFKYELPKKQAKLAQMGRRIWQVQEKDDAKAADQAIRRTEEFFNSIGMKTKLVDYGIDPKDAATKISERFRQRGMKIGEHGDIDAAAVEKILVAC